MMNKGLREIGSEFNLSLKVLTSPQIFDLGKYLDLDAANFVLLRGGRTALQYYLKYLAPCYDGEYLLPAYLCEAILYPFEFEGIKFSFYHVGENLQIDLADLSARVSNRTRGIFIIHYFGFPQPQEVMDYLENLREQGIDIIEDMTQSFFTEGENVGRVGNYAIASFRKYLPIPDGGILYSYQEKVMRVRLLQGYDKYFRKRLKGLVWKDIYLARGGSKGFLKSFRLGETFYDSCRNIRGMTGFSRFILKKTDTVLMRQKRRENFLTLLSEFVNLQGIRPLYTELPVGVCPLGFPVLVGRKRDQLRAYLIERGIYPPVHWELPKQVNPVVYDREYGLSRGLLTIPCDQRYDTSDMRDVAYRVSQFCRRGTFQEDVCTK